MGEGTPQPQSGKLTNRLWLMFGGTCVVLAAGLVLMQTFRAQPGQAAGEASGTAKLNGAAQPADKLAKPWAKVGKETITYDMVAQESVARYGKDVLDDLINRMIIQQACEKAGVSVTEEDVSAEINRIAKRFNLEPDAWYKMLQAERNITPLQYRQSVVWPMLALKKLAGEQVDITDAEMDEAFERNYGPRVKARLILVDNARRAQEVWSECQRTPDEFEQLAQKHSIDASSRALGGTIPPIPRHSGNPTIEDAAFKLKAGEISGLIELQTGRYAILKCEGWTEQTVSNIDEVREILYDDLKEQKTQAAVAKVFEHVKKNATVDNYLTGTTTAPSRPGSQPAAGAIQQTGNSVPQGAPMPRATNAAAPGKTTLKR